MRKILICALAVAIALASGCAISPSPDAFVSFNIAFNPPGEKPGLSLDSDPDYIQFKYEFGDAHDAKYAFSMGGVDLDGDHMEDSAQCVEGHGVTVHFADGSMLPINSVELDNWAPRFKLESADLTGDGNPELVFIGDTGANGGDGSYHLLVYAKTRGVWEPLDAPGYGFPYYLCMEGDDAVVACDSTGFSQSVSRKALEAHYDRLAMDDWKDFLCKPGEQIAADGISGFFIGEKDVRKVLKLRQYVTGPTGVHTDCLGYAVTTLSFDEDGNYSVVDSVFVITD